MNKLFITLLFAVVTMSLQAQKVTFVSQEFEAGVKTHLGLGDTDEVIQAQTDTITVIDLSGLEIVDISDVATIPNVVWLNLADNKIEDVLPLASLEHLHYVNLINNSLESINPLVFACTDSLHANVADNYIQEYTHLFSVTSCQLLLEGMGAQKQEKNAPFFDVHQLYVDVNDEGVPMVFYRGFTNMEADVALDCGSTHVVASMDGYTNSVTLPSDLGTTTQVILSNGEKGDTTWVVPQQTFQVVAEEVLSIETGLPETYTISSSYAIHGTAAIDDGHLIYTAPADFESDVLFISYYEGRRLRGFTQYQIRNINATLTGDVNGDGLITIADVTALVNIIMGKDTTGQYNHTAADVNQDNSITFDDVAALVNFILGNN